MGHWVFADGYRCVYVPGFSWETSSHFRHRRLPVEPALFFRWNNPGHPDMHRTLSRQGLHCCNHIFVSCMGSHYCKNIWRVSVNHLVLGGCHWKELLGKVFWSHFPVTIQILLDAFSVDLVAVHSSRLPPEGERGPHFPWMPHLLEAR